MVGFLFEKKVLDLLLFFLQIFESLEPSPYSAFSLYNYGALAMEKTAAGDLTDAEYKNGEEAFHRAHDHWRQQTHNTSLQVPWRNYNRQLSFYTKSSPSNAPDLAKFVSEEDLDKAQDIVRMFEGNLMEECPRWPLVTFYLAKADFHLRKENKLEGMF